MIDKDGNITALRRNFDLKRRESKKLPPERLRQILSRTYPKETVDDLMNKLIDTPTEKGGEGDV